MSEIIHCDECGRLTKNHLVGRDKMKYTSEEIAFSILNIGIYPILKRIAEPPAKYMQCEKCERIVKIKKRTNNF